MAGKHLMRRTLEEHLTPDQRRILAGLDSPFRIQTFLDALPYADEKFNRCPLRVLQDGRGNCFDGALFAAVALRRLGHPPVIVDLLAAPGTDDDHTIAIYRQNGFLGAVAKSNCVGLRFREAVYRSLRELVISYFEFYFNVEGEKTLREYTLPLNLEPFDHLDWTCSDDGLEPIIRRLGKLRRYPLITPQMAAALSPVDARTYEAGFLGANPAGLYRPAYSKRSGSRP